MDRCNALLVLLVLLVLPEVSEVSEVSVLPEALRERWTPLPYWVLGVADRVVPTLTPEAGVAWSLAGLAPAEVRFEGKVYTHSHVLQHLGVYLPEWGVLFLERREGSLEVVQAQRGVSLLPRILALSEQVVVEPTALLKHAAHLSGLLASRVEAVEECLTHAYNLAHKFALCNSEADFQGLLRRGGLIPIAEARGLARCEMVKPF